MAVSAVAVSAVAAPPRAPAVMHKNNRVTFAPDTKTEAILPAAAAASSSSTNRFATQHAQFNTLFESRKSGGAPTAATPAQAQAQAARSESLLRTDAEQNLSLTKPSPSSSFIALQATIKSALKLRTSASPTPTSITLGPAAHISTTATTSAAGIPLTHPQINSGGAHCNPSSPNNTKLNLSLPNTIDELRTKLEQVLTTLGHNSISQIEITGDATTKYQIKNKSTHPNLTVDIMSDKTVTAIIQKPDSPEQMEKDAKLIIASYIAAGHNPTGPKDLEITGTNISPEMREALNKEVENYATAQKAKLVSATVNISPTAP